MEPSVAAACNRRKLQEEIQRRAWLPRWSATITSGRREITVALKHANIMATKRKYPPTAERVGIFQVAWREIAPEGNFAGMTLAAFETKTVAIAQSVQRLQALDAQYAAELKGRAEADTAARKAMRIVANSVRGDPAYGEDSTSDGPRCKCRPVHRKVGGLFYLPESSHKAT